MARGNHSNQRGGPGGGRGGRGNRGRGRGRGTGRGRGVSMESSMSFREDIDAGQIRGGYVPVNATDVPIQLWQGNDGYPSPRTWGRGRAFHLNSSPGPSFPRGGSSPRARGRGNHLQYVPIPDDIDHDSGDLPFRGGSNRGRGRGRGNLASKLRTGTPLSKVWYADRPLLRPVEFVRSVQMATLFQQEEEMIQPIVEDPTDNEKSHAPTADTISRIFGGEMDGDSEGDEDIEEIDFADIGKLQAAIDSAAAQTRHLSKSTLEEKFTGFYIDTTPAPISETVAHNFTGRILGEDSDDDEVIVYEAPNPRAGPPTPPIEQDRPTTQILPPADSQSLESSIVTPQVDDATKAQFPITAEPGEPKSTESGVVQDIPTSAVGNPHNAKTLPIISPGDIAPFNIPVEINSSPHRDVAMDADPEANISPLANLTPNVLASLMPAANLGGPESLTSIDKDLTHSGTVDVLGQAPSLQPPDKPVPSSSTHSGSKIPPAPSFEDVTFKLLASAQKTYQRKIHPVGTPRSLLRNSRRSKKMRRSFAALGASLSEAHLREGVDGKEVDPRKNEQRRGDSDVDWGDATSDEDEQVGVKNRNGKGRAQEEEEGIEEVMNGVDGMMVDDDYNLNSMKSFVASMSTEGSRFKTMDDLADEEKMKKEDLESDSNVGSQEKETEAEDAVDAETTDEMEEEEEEDSSDEEETAESGFQARLRKIRSRKKGKTRANEDEDEDDMYISLDEDWEQEDEADILAQEVQAFLDENAEMLTGKNRKQRRAILRASSSVHFDLDEYESMMSSPAKRKRAKDIPLELREQWEKDRYKKAENKKKRACDRQRAEAEFTGGKKGKKGWKAKLAAMRASDDEDSSQSLDIVAVERSIRRFLLDLDSHKLELPPCNKQTRIKLHEIANAFQLKSSSQGKGKNRFTTLTRTAKSGVRIDEKKIRRILQTGGGSWDSDGRKGKGGKATSLAKHREGEEVGKSAPKIGESNVGFQMLAAMGWSEGDRIGLSGGLDAPLKAIMKKSKLGLGAL